MSAVFFWGSLAVLMLCIGAIAYTIVILIKDWNHYDSENRMDAVTLALKGISGIGFMGIGSFIILFISWLFYQPGHGQVFAGFAIGGGIAAVAFFLKWRKSRLIGTQATLQEGRVVERLQEMGYESGVYVFGMLGGSSPCILNFTEDGVDFLELNSTCRKYTLHSCVDIENIADISLRKGTRVNTLTILLANGMKRRFSIPSTMANLSWQQEKVIRMQEFIQEYFPEG